jgi:hypothetical protein
MADHPLPSPSLLTSNLARANGVTDLLFALLVGKLVGVPFFFMSPCNVAVGVSGFEGREVFSR